MKPYDPYPSRPYAGKHSVLELPVGLQPGQWHGLTRTKSKCNLTGGVAKAVFSCDFAFFAAIMAPEADKERFRTICDWGNWIFPFDDLFDDGVYSNDFSGAQFIIQYMLKGFDEDRSKIDAEHNVAPIVNFHDDIWARITRSSTMEVSQTYRRAMEDYCVGTLDQVSSVEMSTEPSLEQMLLLRRKSVCVASLFALVQFGHEITLPDFVLEDARIREIETIGIDLTLMHNDLLPFDKEDHEGVPHNLVAVCRSRGLSAQAAVNCLAELIQDRHKRLRTLMANVPDYGTPLESQLARYLEGIQDVVKANLYWSFRSARFLSAAQKKSILENMTIEFRA